MFVSNVRPEALARAGLDHASLAKRNPRLIHCSILAFGRGGRYFNRPAYDPVIQSLSGVAGTIARATGEPRFVPMVMSDHTSGLIAAQAIGFALYRREKTGKGEAIDVPMLENMASFVSSEHLGAATFDPPVGPTGDGRLLSPNYRPLPTKDGYITVRPNTNAQAFAFFDAIGRPELKTDPRFDSAASRTKNAAAYFEVQATGLAHKTTDEWVEMFDKLDVPAARYNTIDDLMTDPHLKDVGFFREEEHPSEGKIRRTQARQHLLRRRARGRDATRRCYGEHTREILAELGYSAGHRQDGRGQGSRARHLSSGPRASARSDPGERRLAAGDSERLVALDQHALHDAPLADRIVDIDPVHGGAVVPDHAVADRAIHGRNGAAACALRRPARRAARRSRRAPGRRCGRAG